MSQPSRAHQRAPGCHALGAVGAELHRHLAAHAVGAPDVADLEEVVLDESPLDSDPLSRRGIRCRRRCRRGSRRRGRPCGCSGRCGRDGRSRARGRRGRRGRRDGRGHGRAVVSTRTASGSSTIEVTMCVSTAAAVGAASRSRRRRRRRLRQCRQSPAQDRRRSTVWARLASRRTARARPRSPAACSPGRWAGRPGSATSRPCRCRRRCVDGSVRGL